MPKTKTSMYMSEELLNLLKIKAALKGLSLAEATNEAVSAYVEDIRPHAAELRKKLKKQPPPSP